MGFDVEPSQFNHAPDAIARSEHLGHDGNFPSATEDNFQGGLEIGEDGGKEEVANFFVAREPIQVRHFQ